MSVSYEMSWNERTRRYRIWRVTHELVVDELTTAKAFRKLAELRHGDNLLDQGETP